ncbi:MAG TPA: aminotransferase class I/II-fold pyridoxal phosphate-dependent enzyme, partial [Bacteroidetes bacterium]|nr:aminotransferase class I/II-fold pyridoxal phosphate-dependent enzyme [Bacteroidota bacterium]HEX04602.1 aminotransferase class I/II-fold pyridoxal phosphate-dependent enzyme [Bacteroidota bacterium]
MILAERIRNLPPYLFASLEAKASELRAKGVDLIDLGIADPDLPPVSTVKNSLIHHLDDPDAHQYPTSQGDPEVRRQIAAWLRGRFGIEINPVNEICVTMGSKEGLANLARAFAEPGSFIAATDPGYPVYANAGAILNGADFHALPLLPENGFLPDLNQASGARILYLNYPNNPTGAIAPESFYREVAVWADDNPDTLVVMDAAYCELSFQSPKPPSTLQFSKNVIEFHSLSKMMNVTGYRIGFAVGKADVIAALTKVKTQLDSGAPVFIQRAMADALATYDGQNPPPEAQRSHDEYAARKNLIEDGLKHIPGVLQVYP